MKEEHSAKIQQHYSGYPWSCSKHLPVVTPDGEYVCTKCGVVLSDSAYDLLEDERIDSSLSSSSSSSLSTSSSSGPSSSSPITDLQMPNPKSNISLFLSHKLGGSAVRNLPGLSTARSLEIANREDDDDFTGDIGGEKRGSSKKNKKKKGANAYLSRFSNACSKLGLTHAESEHAWQLFSRLCDELRHTDTHIVINTSELACYTIAAGVAATTKRVLGERAIASAVMFAFRSKSVRDLYSIRRVVETHSEAVTGISKPPLTASAKWIRGRY